MAGCPRFIIHQPPRMGINQPRTSTSRPSRAPTLSISVLNTKYLMYPNSLHFFPSIFFPLLSLSFHSPHLPITACCSIYTINFPFFSPPFSVNSNSSSPFTPYLPFPLLPLSSPPYFSLYGPSSNPLSPPIFPPPSLFTYSFLFPNFYHLSLLLLFLPSFLPFHLSSLPPSPHLSPSSFLPACNCVW